MAKSVWNATGLFTLCDLLQGEIAMANNKRIFADKEKQLIEQIENLINLKRVYLSDGQNPDRIYREIERLENRIKNDQAEIERLKARLNNWKQLYIQADEEIKTLQKQLKSYKNAQKFKKQLDVLEKFGIDTSQIIQNLRGEIEAEIEAENQDNNCDEFSELM
jgi:septal ring factor EnvC (AmiA/AmiB activator)